MEDREDSSMFLEDAGGGQTLLVYCEGEEEALNNPSSGLLQDPREDMVWVVGGGGGGEEGVLLPDELGEETLLLLGDHLSLLPTPPDLTLLPQISAEEMPNNNNSNNNNNNNSSMRTATHAHTSATHTQRTYTNPKCTYTDAHTKSAATLRMYTNPKLAYTGAHTNPVVTTTATTASTPKAYMSVHTESTQLRTYTNTKKSTYKNVQQQKTSVQEREANTHRQTHTLTNTQAHPFTQMHKQIKPQAPSPLTQTYTQTHPFTQTPIQAKTQPSLTLTHPHTQVHPHTQPPSPLTNTHPHPHPHSHPSPITDLSALRAKLVSGCKSSLDEDELSEEPFVGPSLRWATQTPKSYRGAKLRDAPLPPRKNGRKVPQRADTDGETSGMGSSVDEPVESSTESASEAPSTPPAFIQPRPSASRGPSSTSPTAIKKRRGGWPKGRKRKPELPGAKPPKAPLTAYVLFLNERRKYYRETRPELSFGAVTKVLGAEWSAMSVEQKAAFVSRSEQDKRRYRNELQAYRQSHDYQLLLRKKRIKNVIRRGGTTTEESSDFTDEIDDDDSEELYCRICDQLFTSLHNKREHLYGKTHLQAITGEYQRERLAEEERQMAAALRLGQGAGDCLTCGSPLTPLTPHTLHLAPARRGVDSLLVGCPSCSPSPAPPQSPRTPQEDDHDGDKEDEEEEEEEEDGQDEGGVSSTPPSPLPPPSESITEALEGVMAKVMAREEEIHVLRRSSAAAVAAKEELSATLNRLQARGQRLGAARDALDRRNAELKAAAEALWRLPALFGVTPLQMVEVTTRISQDDTEIQEDGAEIEEQMKELQHQEEEEEEEEEEDILCQQEEQEEELVLQDEGIHLQQQDMEDVPQSEPKLVEHLLMQRHDSVLHGEGLVSDRDGLQQQQQQQQQVQNKAILQAQFLSQGENFHQQQQPSEKIQFLQLQLQEQQWPQQVQQQQWQEQQKLQLHQEKLQQQQLIYVEDLQFNQLHQQQQHQQEEIAIEIQDEEVLQNQFLQQQQQQLGKKQVEEAEEVVISEEELHLLGQQLQPLQLGNQQQGEQSDKLQIVEHEQSVLTEVQHPQQLLLNNQQIHLLQQQQQQQQQLLIIHENEGIQPQLPPPPPPPPPPPQQRQRQRQILLLEGKVDGTCSKQQEEDVVKETEEEDKKTAVTKQQQQQQQQQQQKRHVLPHCPRHNTTQPHTCKLERDGMQQQVEKGHHRKTEGLAKHTLTQNSQTKQLQTPKQRDVKQKTRAPQNVPHKQDRLDQQQQFILQHVQQTDQQHFRAFSKPQQQRGRQPKQQKVTFVQQTAENTAGEHQKIHKTLSSSRTTKEPERGLLQHQGSMISIQHQPQTQVSRINDEELFEASFDPQAFQGRLELELPEDLGLQEEEDLLQQDLFDLQHQEGEIGTRDLILLDNT